MIKSLPLIVIVGPTASGKSNLALKLAKKFDGEIICADSRTVYKGLDIGTAKPSEEDRALVPHWGLDLVNPGEYFSASDFKAYAIAKIDEIRHRGRVPFLVGGTGLYIDSIIFDFKFGVQVNTKLRQDLQEKSVQELQDYCVKNNINLPENHKNKKYLIRTIENFGVIPERLAKPIVNSVIVGITTEKDELISRIEKRTDGLIRAGAIEEAEALAEKYGWDSEAMTSNIYRAARLHGDSPELMKVKTVTLDWRLAKRQMTWFKRNKFIEWRTLRLAEEYISSRLADDE